MIEENRSSIQDLDHRMGDIADKAYAGVAAAIAIAPIAPPLEPGQTAVMMGAGTYESQSALGLTVTHHLETESQREIFINGGVSISSENTVASRVMMGIVF
jgi:autotransporter adhesin